MKQHQAKLVLADGTVFYGEALGAIGHTVGEVCFNTSITGYQEILTDPSYTEQIMTFTQPHIGNVGINQDDMESDKIAVSGCIVRAPSRITSSYRSSESFSSWLQVNEVVGIANIDTRKLVRHLRQHGAQNGTITSDDITEQKAQDMALQWPSLEGRDLVSRVSCTKKKQWQQGGCYDLDQAAWASAPPTSAHVVAFDFGCKQTIFRKLTERGLKLTIVPADTSAKDVIAMQPDGIFLSNGPGDPAAVGYAVETIRQLLTTDIPMFGICMGHQLLSQALGLKTFKLKFGHRGGNHPVSDEQTKKIEITSQNHGFAVRDSDIPNHIEVTHRSLFDGTIEGIQLKDRPVFSVQYHPEASPGPQDSDYLFDRFAALLQR